MVNKATETNNPRKRQLKPIDSNNMEDIIEEKRIHMSTQKDNSLKVTEEIDQHAQRTDTTTQSCSESNVNSGSEENSSNISKSSNTDTESFLSVPQSNITRPKFYEK